MSSDFVEFFGITVFFDEWNQKKNMVHDREGTERCSVYMGPRFGSFCVLFWNSK